MTRKAITEEMGEHKVWYEQARDIKVATLPEFMRHLTEDYDHDYGTICHACAAAAIAAAWAVNDAPCGGITGFQAGAIMWQFVQKWMSMDGPMRLVQYSELLYPQYEHKFEKVISQTTADWLKEQAVKQLAEMQGAAPAVKAHMERVAEGWLPFGFTIEKE